MWILTDECDSLLFSCLAAVGRGEQFPVEEAEQEPGKFLRRPACCGECSSTTSRDMQMGLLVYSLHFGRADILRRLWTYGWKHFWKMGDEKKRVTVSVLGYEFSVPENRTFYTPGLVILLAACLAYVTGRVRLARFLSRIPQLYTSAPGYVCHLSMLHIYLNLRIRGKLLSSEASVLREILQHSPRNILAHLLLGNRNSARFYMQKYWPEGEKSVRYWDEKWVPQRADEDSGLTFQTNPAQYQENWDYMFLTELQRQEASEWTPRTSAA